MLVFCSSRSEYIFKFDDKFEMHDDAEVLKRMGLLFGEFYISYICMLIAYILLDFIFLKVWIKAIVLMMILNVPNHWCHQISKNILKVCFVCSSAERQWKTRDKIED